MAAKKTIQREQEIAVMQPAFNLAEDTTCGLSSLLGMNVHANDAPQEWQQHEKDSRWVWLGGIFGGCFLKNTKFPQFDQIYFPGVLLSIGAVGALGEQNKEGSNYSETLLKLYTRVLDVQYIQFNNDSLLV